jgi:sigma-B regulation protein RsbU (phosphoserine phosphatase)
METEKEWRSTLRTFLRSVTGDPSIRVGSVTDEMNPITFVDSGKSDWQSWARGFDRAGRSLVLVVDEKDMLPKGEDLALVDDVLVYPFRVSEILSMVRHHFQKRELEEIREESGKVLSELFEANQLIEKVIQARTPSRFTGIKGIQVMSRHLSGLKPGGDYFDLFESESKDFLNILLVDSSSYGISAALLGMILSSSAKIASSAHLSAHHWVKSIYEELKVTLGEQGHFSLFFGRLNRRDYSLRYQSYGSIEGYHLSKSGSHVRLEKTGDAISNRNLPGEEAERVIYLEPNDRVVLLSDGFVKGVGGEVILSRLFSEKQEQEPFALVNELTFQIKSKLSPGETFPGEDCSAIVFDIESRVLRLAPVG